MFIRLVVIRLLSFLPSPTTLGNIKEFMSKLLLWEGGERTKKRRKEEKMRNERGKNERQR